MTGRSHRHVPVRRARLGKWLRWAKLISLPLTGVGELCRSLFPPKPAVPLRRRRPVVLDLQGLEKREVPLALFYTALTPAAALGFGGTEDLATPGSVVLHGWPSVPTVDYSAAMALPAGTRDQGAEEDNLSDASLQGVFAAWEEAANTEAPSATENTEENSASTSSRSPLDPFAHRTQPQADAKTEEAAPSGSGYHGGLPAHDPSLAGANAQSGGGEGTAITPAIHTAGSTSELGGASLGAQQPDLQTAWAATDVSLPTSTIAAAPAAVAAADGAAAPAAGANATATATAGNAVAVTPSASTPLTVTTSAATAQNSLTTLDSGFGPKDLVFEPNVGQSSDPVKFLSRQAGMTVFLTSVPGATFVTPVSHATAATYALHGPNGTVAPTAVSSWDAFGLHLLGANPNPQIVGSQELLSRSNYFLGSDSSAWYTDVPNYGAITYQNVYPGIDLQFHGDASHHLEYDFIVHPGADSIQIQVGWQGVQSLRSDTAGNLLLQTPGGSIVQQAPLAYQQGVGGSKSTVTVGQSVRSDGTVSFAVGTHDASHSVVIDPVLSFSSYLGGSGDDKAYGIASDGYGNSFIVGSTASANYPTTTGVYQSASGGSTTDAFITKLDPSGKRLWSGYLGGSDTDEAYAVAVDAAGNVYLTGQELSTNFPTTNGAWQSSNHHLPGFGPQGPLGGANAFVTKFSPAGYAILFSTYLGEDGTAGYAIGVDSNGSPYIAGATAATNFHVTAGALQAHYGGGSLDGWVVKMNGTAGTELYSSYLGGAATDQANAVAIDAQGHAYVGGYTTSTDFPTASGAYQSTNKGGQDGFVVEMGTNGTSAVYSSYFGGGGTDAVNAIAVDVSGNAYLGA